MKKRWHVVCRNKKKLKKIKKIIKRVLFKDVFIL